MVQFFDAWLGLYLDQGQDTNAMADRHTGQGLIEYALLIWFIAIVVFVALVFFRDHLITLYSRVGNSIPN